MIKTEIRLTAEARNSFNDGGRVMVWAGFAATGPARVTVDHRLLCLEYSRGNTEKLLLDELGFALNFSVSQNCCILYFYFYIYSSVCMAH